MILLEIFQNCFIVGYDGKKIPFVKIVIKHNICHEGID